MTRRIIRHARRVSKRRKIHLSGQNLSLVLAQVKRAHYSIPTTSPTSVYKLYFCKQAFIEGNTVLRKESIT